MTEPELFLSEILEPLYRAACRPDAGPPAVFAAAGAMAALAAMLATAPGAEADDVQPAAAVARYRDFMRVRAVAAGRYRVVTGVTGRAEMVLDTGEHVLAAPVLTGAMVALRRALTETRVTPAIQS